MLQKIYKLSTSWCPPCKAFEPTFQKVSQMEKYKDIQFKSIDVENDENGEELVEKYNVRSVPTTVFLDENENVLYKLMGNTPEKDFVEIIEKSME